MSSRFLPTVDAFLTFFSDEPFVRGMQILLFAAAASLVFLVFYVTRDILHRTRSLIAQVSCILLVAALPLAGFLLYLLVRPSRTLEERDMHEKIAQILHELQTRKPLPLPGKAFSPRAQVSALSQGKQASVPRSMPAPQAQVGMSQEFKRTAVPTLVSP